MDPGILVTLLLGTGTTIAACITAWKTAPSVKLGNVLTRLDTLENQIGDRDKAIDELSSWQLAARAYIYTLSNRLADAGFDVPDPPEALHIAHRGD